MHLQSMFCSLTIIAPLFQFVKMPKSTIFLMKVCKKSGKCKKMKKISKTIDKRNQEWYNITEVERNLKNKEEFPFSPYHA